MEGFQRFSSEALFEKLVHRGRKFTPDRFGDKKRYVLTDQEISQEKIDYLGERIENLDGLSDEEVANSVFYIYFLCDDDVLPHVSRIHKNGGIYIPHMNFKKTHYRFVNPKARLAMMNSWRKAERVSHLTAIIHENICEAMELTKHLEGDYIEIGVFKGGSANTALAYMSLLREENPELPKRHAYLLDTFEGFNYEEAEKSSDAIWSRTHSLFGKDETIAYIDETLSDHSQPYDLIASNVCVDELPEGCQKIALANVDVDMYEPTVDALEKVHDRLVVGGIIICEDATSTPGLYGAYLALREFMETEKGKCYTCIFKTGQYFLIRNK